MSEALAADADLGAESTAAPAEGETGGAEAGGGPDYVATATRMGWVPEDQWDASKGEWRDAETFVKLGDEKAHLKVKGLEKELGEVKKTLKKFAEHNARTEERAYERAKADLKAELAAAVEAGDKKAASEITDDMVRLEASKAAAPASDDFAETFEAWKADNPWYETDADMAAFAYGLGEKLGAEGMTPTAQLAEVTKRVKAAFPHKFENPRRREAGAVEGSTAIRRQAGKTYSDLPADAKAACDEFVKRIPGFTKDKYVKDFFGDKA